MPPFRIRNAPENPFGDLGEINNYRKIIIYSGLSIERPEYFLVYLYSVLFAFLEKFAIIFPLKGEFMKNIINLVKNNIISYKNSFKYHIIMDNNKYELLQKSEKVADKTYSINLVKTILDEYYYNIRRLYKNCEDEICLFVRNGSDLTPIHIDTNINFIKSITLLKKHNLLNNNQIRKYSSLVSLIDNKNSMKKLTEGKFKYYYEGKEKEYRSDIIINLLSLDTIAFKKKFESENIIGLEKDELLVLLATFIKNIDEKKYIYPNNLLENAKYIQSITNEYSVLGKIKLMPRPSYLNQIKLNEQFEKYIMNQVPENLSIYEKAIFIYIRLCKILTHDEEDTGEISYINHKNPNRIKTINENNNIIVCYEFVAIYTKFLDILGLDYEIIGGRKYGTGHSSLNIVYKDSLTNVEATKGLFNCDLTRVKNNIRICGFNPIKYNPKTQKKLIYLLKMYISFYLIIIMRNTIMKQILLKNIVKI